MASPETEKEPIDAFRNLDCVLYGSLGNVDTCDIGYYSLSNEFRSYRAANSIFLKDGDFSLSLGEKQFRRIFDEELFPHLSFFTYGSTKLPLFVEEATNRPYKDISVFPIRSKKLVQKTEDLSGFRFVQIIEGQDWQAYDDFLRKTYIDHEWMNTIFPAMAMRMSRNAAIRRFILIQDADVIGTLCLIHWGGYIRLENVVIRPDMRRRGLGEILMGFAEKMAREIWDGHTLILTSALTEAADKLYSRYGFQVVGHKAEIQDY